MTRTYAGRKPCSVATLLELHVSSTTATMAKSAAIARSVTATLGLMHRGCRITTHTKEKEEKQRKSCKTRLDSDRSGQPARQGSAEKRCKCCQQEPSRKESVDALV